MSARPAWRHGTKLSGFSLVEVILAIVILSVGIAGLLGVFTAATRQSADPLIHKQALSVAEALLQEIQLKNFSNPAGGFTGPATQANRAFFDDIGDYNGFVTNGVFTIDGAAVAGLSNYNIAVGVAGSAIGPAGLVVAAASSMLITVTVSYPGGTVALSGYRTAYAPDA
jgi:MSHA pilin protein MshD